jgi:hypothetical protein
MQIALDKIELYGNVASGPRILTDAPKAMIALAGRLNSCSRGDQADVKQEVLDAYVRNDRKCTSMLARTD